MERISQRQTITKFDMFVLYIFVALCSLAGVLAEKPISCQDVEPLQGFNMTKYMGTWYEQGNFGWTSRRMCIEYTLEYAAQSDEIRINYFALPSRDRYYMYERSGEIHVPDSSKPGQFEITHLPYQSTTILGTDYTSYSIECAKYTIARVVKIVTRKPNPPQSVIDEAMRVIREKGLTTDGFSKTDQRCSKLDHRIE